MKQKLIMIKNKVIKKIKKKMKIIIKTSSQIIKKMKIKHRVTDKRNNKRKIKIKNKKWNRIKDKSVKTIIKNKRTKKGSI
jgi:hypothetical protein